MVASSSGPSSDAGAARELVFLGAPSTSPRGGTQTLAAPWWFTGEDALRLVVINSLVGVSVTLQGRFLPRGGVRPDPFVHVVTPSSDRMPSTFDRPLGDGFLLNCSLIVTSGAPLVGHTYVMLQVIRGSTGATIVLGCLLGGYVTAMQHVAYPGSPIESSIAGGGVLRTILGTDPPAGAEVSETVPAGARWELLALAATLVADATPANRLPSLLLDAGGNAFTRVIQPVLTAASGSNAYYWAQGLPVETGLGGVPLAGIPTAPVLLAGGRFRTATSAMQAGDNWTAPLFVVREYLEAA